MLEELSHPPEFLEQCKRIAKIVQPVQNRVFVYHLSSYNAIYSV